jgi:hypothetical protein
MTGPTVITSEQWRAWRELRARVLASTRQHEADICRSVAEAPRLMERLLERMREQLREQAPAMAELTDEQLGLKFEIVRNIRKIARKRAIADERGHVATEAEPKLRHIQQANAEFWEAKKTKFEQAAIKHRVDLVEGAEKAAALEPAIQQLKQVIPAHIDNGSLPAITALIRLVEQADLSAHMDRAEGRLATIRTKANEKRKTGADAEVLATFRAWEKSCVGVLNGLSVSQRVEKYITTQRPTDRQRRRLHALSKAGAI